MQPRALGARGRRRRHRARGRARTHGRARARPYGANHGAPFGYGATYGSLFPQLMAEAEAQPIKSATFYCTGTLLSATIPMVVAARRHCLPFLN